MTQEELERYALEKYPVIKETYKSNIGDWFTTYDVNERVRKAFVDGYNEVRKETVEDIGEIYLKGRENALRDCPKWKKAERDIDSPIIDFAVLYTNDGGDDDDYDTVTVTNRLHKGEWYIELSELEHLLKEKER